MSEERSVVEGLAAREGAYSVVREPRHETLRVRGLDTHITRWGPAPSAAHPPVVLLHGWLDAGGSFQFMVDAMRHERPMLALDWRGFGRSEWPQDGYWFADYLGDLDALLELVSPQASAALVGHSMGGNIASLYAGLRPERVKCVVNLEGFGLPRTAAGQAPQRMRDWLQQLKSPRSHKHYDSFEQLAAVIHHRYPRLGSACSRHVARLWGVQESGGRVRLAADPRHQWVNPLLYKREDAEAIWAEIRAPMLLMFGSESEYLRRLGDEAGAEAFRRFVPQARLAAVADAGHMLHMEKPAIASALLEDFLEALRE